MELKFVRFDLPFAGNEEYDYFLKLMDILKLQYERTGKTKGFWCNRLLILKNVRDLTIAVDTVTDEIVGFNVIDKNTGEIIFIESFRLRQGVGTDMLVNVSERMDCDFHVKHSLPEAAGFWEAMSIPYKVVH